MTKRIEDLIQESSALKAPLIPHLQTLVNDVPELVNFGFSLAQQVMPYLSDVRSSKNPFQLANVLSFVKQCVASSVGKKQDKEGPALWEAVSLFFNKLGQEVSSFLQVAAENENVVKSKHAIYIPGTNLMLCVLCSHWHSTLGRPHRRY